nr:hypothetical protein [Bacillaceae bacterium]
MSAFPSAEMPARVCRPVPRSISALGAAVFPATLAFVPANFYRFLNIRPHSGDQLTIYSLT